MMMFIYPPGRLAQRRHSLAASATKGLHPRRYIVGSYFSRPGRLKLGQALEKNWRNAGECKNGLNNSPTMRYSNDMNSPEKQRHIAVVEDDPDQRQNVTDALLRRGYQVSAYADRQSAREAFAQQLPDLAILDIMLGNDSEGGFDLCRDLLAMKADMPIIFLTSRADDVDRISGMRLGAWDYQTKPVSLEYLAERVHSVFRWRGMETPSAGENDEAILVDNLQMDKGRVSVKWMQQPIILTYTEFRVLQEVVERRNERGASYDVLADATRQGVVQNNTINTHIQHIRSKFRKVDPSFDCIKTVYGFGYTWNCE
jgi:two-component system OmpR family response regulator